MYTRALSTLTSRTLRASTSSSIKTILTSSSSRYITYSSTLFSDAKPVETAAEAKLAADALTAGAQGMRKVENGANVSPKIAQLADVILTLNLMEAMQLSEVLKTRLGVSDTAMPFGAPMMGMVAPQQAAAAPTAAAPPPAAAPAPAPAKEEKKSCRY